MRIYWSKLLLNEDTRERAIYKAMSVPYHRSTSPTEENHERYMELRFQGDFIAIRLDEPPVFLTS